MLFFGGRFAIFEPAMRNASDASICDVYIDESSQNNHEYFVIGGLIVPIEIAPELTNRILAIRLPELPQGEMKWAKVSKGKLAAYQRVVDLFFEPEFAGAIEYHSLVVEAAKQNHGAFNSGSREIGFNKEIFHLAYKFSRLYPSLFHIYLDERTTAHGTDELRLMLNRKANKTDPKRDWPYRRVQFRDSAKVPIIQLVDIMSGALAYRLNGFEKADGASPAKCRLADHILKKARVSNVFKDTSMRGKFTIWHRQLRVVP